MPSAFRLLDRTEEWQSPQPCTGLRSAQLAVLLVELIEGRYMAEVTATLLYDPKGEKLKA